MRSRCRALCLACGGSAAISVGTTGGGGPAGAAAAPPSKSPASDPSRHTVSSAFAGRASTAFATTLCASKESTTSPFPASFSASATCWNTGLSSEFGLSGSAKNASAFGWSA